MSLPWIPVPCTAPWRTSPTDIVTLIDPNYRYSWTRPYGRSIAKEQEAKIYIAGVLAKSEVSAKNDYITQNQKRPGKAINVTGIRCKSDFKYNPVVQQSNPSPQPFLFSTPSAGEIAMV